ncbi:src kinase-associated phosphoprotein 2-like [Anneissia japonica]|uniref:src kinase-associated phosphoprotein 2-like n=1 Tax=Anneissia japonica TaxID=1529436 RepID=UPI0014257F42|nr:src kinase-associated phosphoprotein 2-like [Anneissia japonica]
MDTKLIEEIKNLLKDVENFLTFTLKSASLSKDNTTKKIQLVNSVKNVIQKLTPTEDEPQENYDDVDIPNVEPIPDDCDELYEVTEALPPEADTVSKKSQDEKYEDGDDPYGYGSSGAKIEPIAAEKVFMPSMTGNLEKKSKHLIGKSWQTRYCLIKDNVFYYYKKRSASEQQGNIVLNGYEGRPCPHLESGKKKDCTFELVCPTKRSFQFIAPDIATMNSWIEAVQKASKIPFPTSENTEKVLPDDCDALYEDTAVEEPDAMYDDTDIKTHDQEPEDFDDVYELVESDYADARRKAAEEESKTARPMVLPAIPLPAKPAGNPEPEEDFGGLYDDVSIEPPPPTVPKKDPPSNKPLPQLPGQILSPAQKKPLPSLPSPAVPAKSPVTDSSVTQPSDIASPTSTPAKEQTNGDVTPEPWEEDYNNIYMSKWNCESGSDNELALSRGDLVHILSREYDSYGWWVGEKNFKVGLVPIDYLMKAYRI